MTNASPTPQYENKPLAILMRILSGMAASALVVAIKAASLAGVTPGEMLFYRNAAALPLVTLWVMLGPGLRSVGTARPMAHVTRTALGVTSMMLMFYTIGLLPVAEFTAFLFLVPLFATILSSLFLSEQVGVHRWSAIAVGFAGVLVMTHPGSADGVPLGGLIAGLATAAMVSSVTVTLRQLGATEPATTTVFWFTVMATAATAALLPFFFQPHPPGVWLLIAGVGIAGTTLQITQTVSLQLAPVSVTAPFDYLQLIWSTLLGWVIWSNLPAPASIAGGLLIGAAGLYTFYREHKRQRDTAAATTAFN